MKKERQWTGIQVRLTPKEMKIIALQERLAEIEKKLRRAKEMECAYSTH